MLDDGVPVGFVGFSSSNRYAYLTRAGVLPNHAGKGLYKRMIRKGLAHYRTLGDTHCVTDCTNWNVGSARGLLGAGFMPYWPNVPWSLPNSIYWIKPL